jgi:hypothetical protein
VSLEIKNPEENVTTSMMFSLSKQGLRKKNSQMGSHTHLTLQQPALTKFSKVSKSCENWETTVTTTYHVIHF